MTTLAVTTESDDEPRVALSPETVKKFSALGCRIKVQSGAGARSRFTDTLYPAQGAEIAPSMQAAVADADIVVKVRRPPGSIAGLSASACLRLHLTLPGARTAVLARFTP